MSDHRSQMTQRQADSLAHAKDASTDEMEVTRRRLILMATTGVAVIVVLVAMYWVISEFGGTEILSERDEVLRWIDDLGALGPSAIVAAMTVAIVFSPVPSAPIALAAGAAYGHGWGTLYVLLGSELGAIAAFLIARYAGHGLLRHFLGERLNAGLLGSQRALMATVFVSRLMPFISFDVISYAAGLTGLSFWRFALATLAGILPASFLLAHFGSELASGDATKMASTVLILGALAMVPMIAGLLKGNDPKG